MVNRLEDVESIDKILEGGGERSDVPSERVLETVGEAEKVTGVPSERYFDSMQEKERPGNKIATTTSNDEVQINDAISREDENDLYFDPEFFELDEEDQLNGAIHEFIHGADFNDDMGRLLRDLGFSAEETYHLVNFADGEREENEAAVEYVARVLNPERDRVLRTVEPGENHVEAYEQEVRSLLKYLDQMDSLMDQTREHAIKNDENFYSEVDVRDVDVGLEHYIEEGSYTDEEGEEHDYALLIGDNEEIEYRREELEEQTGIEVYEEELPDYIREGKTPEDEFDDDDDNPYRFNPLGFLDKYEPDVDEGEYEEEERPEYSQGQGPTADLFEPHKEIGSPGNQPALEIPAYEEQGC